MSVTAAVFCIIFYMVASIASYYAGWYGVYAWVSQSLSGYLVTGFCTALWFVSTAIVFASALGAFT